jgi:hypothetical protein
MAHLADWEVMATVRIPCMVVGIPQARVYCFESVHQAFTRPLASDLGWL